MRLDDIKFLWSKNPPYIIYHVTSRCNLNCRHCFNYKEKNKDINELSFEEVAKMSEGMGHVKYLTLAGGEPMLRADLADIVRLFYRNNHLHVVNIVTNGWFTDRTVTVVESILATCPGLTVSVGVSIDGPEDLHDELRQAPGSYQRAMSTVRALKELTLTPMGKRLVILGCGTYHKKNSQHLLAVARFFARSLGVPYSVGLIRGEVPEDSLKNVDIDHFLHISREVNALIKDNFSSNYPFRSLRLALEDVLTDIIRDSVRYNKRTVKCRAGKKGVVMAAGGDILLCELLDVKLGNIRENGYSLVAVLNNEQARQAVHKINQEKCHCTWECFQRLNVIFSPWMYPELALRALKIRKNSRRPVK